MNIKKNIETRRIYVSDFIFFRDFKSEKVTTRYGVISKNCREGPLLVDVRKNQANQIMGSNLKAF